MMIGMTELPLASTQRTEKKRDQGSELSDKDRLANTSQKAKNLHSVKIKHIIQADKAVVIE